MKRSEVNSLLREAMDFLKEQNFKLPDFAYWKPEQWSGKRGEYVEIFDNGLGWDVTDFGSGDYRNVGLLLFTIRNGNLAMQSKYPKPYAEKILIAKENQVTPYHFHWKKMEDIINRGGGNLIVKLYNSTADGEKGTDPVTVYIDGRKFEVEAGGEVTITPGNSITLVPGQYHSFWAEQGHGMVLLGEVSAVNDDNADNRFYADVGRFPAIEEDVAPEYLLFSDYGKFA